MKIKVPDKRLIKKTLKIFFGIIGGLVFLFIILSLSLLIPSVQTFVVGKATDILSKRTQSRVEVGGVRIAFPKTVRLSGIFAEDSYGDTLVYCKLIDIDVALLPLIKRRVQIDHLKIAGLNANVIRTAGDSAFNYSKILAAFSIGENVEKEEKNSALWDLGFEDIELENIFVEFSDHVDSTFLHLELGHFLVNAGNTDFQSMKFDLVNISISKANFAMALPDQQKNKVPEKEHQKTAFPEISVKSLTADDINFKLTIGKDNLALEASLKEAKINPEVIDLEQGDIFIDNILMDGATISYKMSAIETQPEDSSPTISELTFGNFAWNILVKHADIKNTAYKMDLNHEPRLPYGMDYMHMDFRDFNLIADSIFMNKNHTGANVQALSLKEMSAPAVQNISGVFFMDNQHITAENINLTTENSNLTGTIKLSYPALYLIGSEMQQLGIDSDLAGSIDLKEARPFTSMIDSLAYLRNIGSITINNFKSSGTLGDFTVNNLNVTLGDSTAIRFHGHMSGLPTTDLNISYTIDTIRTTGNDLLALLPEGFIPDNIQLPKNIGLSSKGDTDMKNGVVTAGLKTDFGCADFNMKLENGQFESNISIDGLDLGAILSDTAFGLFSWQGRARGRMDDLVPIQFDAKAEMLHAEWNNVIFENITMGARLENDVYTYNIDIADSAITAVLTGDFSQKEDNFYLNAAIDISRLELEQLRLMDEYFMISGNVNASFNGKSQSELSGIFSCEDIRLYRPGKGFYFNEIELKLRMDENSDDFHLTSEVLDASLTGNTSPGELYDALIDHIDLYLELPDSIVSEKDFVFEFNLDLKNSEIFTDFLLDDLIAFELDKCHVSYHDANDILTAHVSMPVLQYQNILLEGLTIDFDTKTDSAVAAFGISKLLFNSISIMKLGGQSIFTKNQAKTKFYLYDHSDSLKYQVRYDISYADSIYYVSIDPESVFMNYEKWAVPNDNLLVLNRDSISATSAQIEKNGQKLGLTTENKVISLSFENFAIENFTEILLADTSVEKLSGILNGFVDFGNILSKTRMIRSDLHVAGLHAGASLLGEFRSAIEYQTGKPFKFDFDLQNQINTLHAAGLADFTENQENISAILEMNITQAEAFLPLFSDYLGHLEGGIKGRIAITGKPENPAFNGSFDLRDLDVTMKPTNTRLLTNGKLLFDNNILSFNAFTFQDHLQNALDIRGHIDFTNFKNPVFDLQAITGDFLVINTVPQKTEALEGKLHLGLDLKVTGPMSKLKVMNNIKINEGTDIYYTMPGNELELITDEGVVEYVDFENPEMEVMLQEKQAQLDDSIISLIKGLDFTTNLMIDPKAKFSLIVDPESGDYSEFFMNGSLQYTYTDVQGGHLSGLLEFEKGFYELSFYGLVKKRFDFQPGSIVSWSGDIMDGDLNFRAKYTVRTNSVGLVSNEISSYERALYNQRLPYDVILKIENKISNPVISFGIDLPARYRSSYQTLDAKLNYMNQTSMEAERNKQVFALLVGGTFIPEDPGITEGAEGSNFATTAARNSVNAIMTQQLNNLTGKFIEGLDVDMGLNTFDDYASGSAQTKTQLDLKVSKNLFNDRVTAEMESHINLDGSAQQMGTQSTAGMTEFAVSYMITKSGNYRIKAFSENSFDIFDGEIQNSGIAFIFIKEFDSFRKKQDNPNVDPGFKEEEEDEEDKDR